MKDSPSTYHNGECKNKALRRKSFFDAVTNSNIKGLRYAGLPHLSPFLEKDLLASYPNAKMFFAEKNYNVYKEQVPLFYDIRANNAQDTYHKHGDIFEQRVPYTLNAVWLDLCSMLSLKTYFDIRKFVLYNDFEKEGVFAFTFTASREHPLIVNFYKQLHNEYNKGQEFNLLNFREETLPKALKWLLKDCLTKNVTLLEAPRYVAKTKANMQFFLYKWESIIL